MLALKFWWGQSYKLCFKGRGQLPQNNPEMYVCTTITKRFFQTPLSMGKPVCYGGGGDKYPKINPEMCGQMLFYHKMLFLTPQQTGLLQDY